MIIATPLKREERGGRAVVAVEDVTASARLESLARSFALDVTTEPDYDPATHEPGKTRLVTPLYRHDQTETGR